MTLTSGASLTIHDSLNTDIIVELIRNRGDGLEEAIIGRRRFALRRTHLGLWNEGLRTKAKEPASLDGTLPEALKVPTKF